MSAEAVGWVWRYSPVEKSALLVHLALADVTNDMHGNKLWCSTDTLCKKTRLSRRAIMAALDALVAQGLLVEKERPGRTTLYQFQFPDLPEQILPPYDIGPVQDLPPGEQDSRDTRAESAPELNTTQTDNPFSRAKNGKCDRWAEVTPRTALSAGTFAACVLKAGHDGPCERIVRELERADLA